MTDSRKKIVIDARLINSSTGTYIKGLLDHLEASDKLRYLALMPASDFELVDNPTIELIDCQVKKFSIDEQTTLVKQIYDLQPDLIHFTLPPAPALTKQNFVTTVHDLTRIHFPDNWKKQIIYDHLMRRTAKRSRHIICPTEYVKQDLVNWARLDSQQISVAYESADRISSKPEVISELEDQKFLLHIGRIHDHKNVEVIIESLKSLPSEIVAVLAGGFSDEQLQSVLDKVHADTQLRQRVVAPGFVSEGEKLWLYQNALAYVVSSKFEGFGLPGLEAMVNDCPVISSDATCLPEVYGDAPLYFNPNSAADLAAKVSSLSSAQRNNLIERGRARAAHFSWTKMASQTLEVYHREL